MTRYLVRRVLGAAALVLGSATIVFFVLDLAPGDAATYLIRPGMTADVADRMRVTFGLDRPVGVRYLKWLGALARGDFGFSLTHRRPVADVLASLLPHTLVLASTALVIAFACGVVLGVLQAVRKGSKVDAFVSAATLFLYSMPSFWLAVMLILVFSLSARNAWGWPFWLPASGMQSVDYDLLSGWARFVDRVAHMVLPTAALALALTAGVARYARAAMLEVLASDFVRTARAKGLPERTVVFKHALRNALLPLITLLGLHLPLLLSGTVFVETVFGWPGMGKAMVDAIQARDYPLVMAGTFVFATLVVLGNLLADLLYAAADPRITHE